MSNEPDRPEGPESESAFEAAGEPVRRRAWLEVLLPRAWRRPAARVADVEASDDRIARQRAGSKRVELGLKGLPWRRW